MTIKRLIGRVNPDLITISGDISYAGQYNAYYRMAEYMDSFGIPFAPVFGNHDNQAGHQVASNQADILLHARNCLFEKGPRSLGCGNYVIKIQEEGRTLFALIMMDSHDRVEFVHPDGSKTWEWASFTKEQMKWYQEQVENLSAEGSFHNALITHIPMYTYQKFSQLAFNKQCNKEMAGSSSQQFSVIWNKGFESSFGVQYEDISSYPSDNGMFDLMYRLGKTKHVISGHNHVNSTSILYQGIRLTYGLKTGPGGYWDRRLNGGTVLCIDSEGKTWIHHEYE